MTTIWSHESGAEGAPLLVTIHGAMDRSASMVKLSRLLDQEFRVLRYDRRGYGRSKPHDGPFTMHDQVDDLMELMGDRRAVLFGHSFGGDVALAAAERSPGLVRAVAVYETPLSWLDWWPGSTRSWPPGQDPAVAAEGFMRRMIGDERWDALPARSRTERLEEGAALTMELADLAAHPPWSSENITMPFAAMYGGATVNHHRTGAVYLAERIPGTVRDDGFDGSAIPIAAAGHNGPYTDPRPVADVLRSLARVAAAREV